MCLVVGGQRSIGRFSLLERRSRTNVERIVNAWHYRLDRVFGDKRHDQKAAIDRFDKAQQRMAPAQERE